MIVIPAYALGLPFVLAALNRAWRGEDGAPKAAWFGFMGLVSFCLTMDVRFTAAWLLVLVGYAVAPTHGMFTAIHGYRPARKDRWLWQWMQWLAGKIAHPGTRSFGVAYGAVRGLLMLPGAELMALYTGSYVPLLVGSLALLQGYAFYKAGLVARAWACEHTAVAIAEVIIGWALGTYLLVCAGLL